MKTYSYSYSYYDGNGLKRPQKYDYTYFYVYHKGKVLFSGKYNEFEIFKSLSKNTENFIVEQDFNEKEYKLDMNKYHLSKQKLINEFKQDLFVDFGVENNPKRNMVFDLAWEYGHSSGLEEVYNQFDRFVELIY